MTKFPNPFELLEKKKNLEDMQNINDAKNIGNTAKDKAPGIATDAFNTAKDKEFSEFLAKDWAKGDLDDADKWRVAIFVNTVLVDIFDTYEKVQKGFVDESHLKMRMHMLKLGTMKAPIAKTSWNYWKGIRSKEFIEWFEREIYGEDEAFKEGYQEDVIPNVRRK